MIVCIAEKPSVGKDIAKVLGATQDHRNYWEGNGYQVTWTFGHLCELKEPHEYTPLWKAWSLSSLPMIPPRFGIKLKNDKGIEEQFRVIERLMQAADMIINCGDAGQEGELIQRWVMQKAGARCPVKRLWISSLTEEAIREGFSNLKDQSEYQSLYEAGLSRAIGDWTLGMNATRLYTLKYAQGRQVLSIGRVQTPTLALIVNRQQEIENFKPEEYWNVDATLGTGHKSFTARLASDSTGKKLLPKNEAEARAIEKGLEGAEYTVGELKKGKRAKQPTPAFITSTLQQEASRRLGFTATRTMRAAQTLYEGVDIAGHGTMGLITYMRTDSLRISDEAVTAAKEYIADAYGEQYICPYKRTWKTKSATAAQDAHEAIRPSVPGLTPDEVDKSISGDTAKLYRMIWSRFMASQMADCQQDTVSVTVSAADYHFKASGYTVTFDGFTVLYEEATDEKEKKETSLPPLEQGQLLKLKELKSEQKFTQPPARYTEATLIKALEENGIGRPSTYAPIITTIIDRGYVEREQKKLKPTLLGRAVDGLMLEQFPHIVDVDFSAQMEKNLDKVESGKADWRKTVDDFYQGFEASLEQAEKNMEGKKVKVPDEPSSEVCDLCGRPMVIKVGKYGKFLACSGFPECRGTKRLVKDTGGICPKCGKGRLLERKSSKGRIYYGCERYPDCDFMTWDMPVATKCEKCGSTLFRKGGKLYCAKEGCGFEMPVPKKD